MCIIDYNFYGESFEYEADLKKYVEKRLDKEDLLKVLEGLGLAELQDLILTTYSDELYELYEDDIVDFFEDAAQEEFNEEYDSDTTSNHEWYGERNPSMM